ncbi:MAG: DUF615 domain-containing protein [Gammaproteobacteria bacterium]|jgi:ribosome-associated protein|nr:DUF615 domain-containing protein [Gammaproteobacteria bacterium]MBT4494288.1 DUF615 domain-containing protein [Gammaproteobacteria bacterium]MBT7372089.1 DUF615 domain-containing protein [Gammaproteobacteria bacterium]
MTEDPEFQEKPSKTQRKRDMDALKQLSARLTDLSADQLSKIDDPAIRDAVTAAKKITKGNARKRQVQYIAKLLSKTNVEPIQTIIDALDASSVAYVQKFHQLETWRERLLDGDNTALDEIFSDHPQCDRQHLRQLLRNAVAERERGDDHIYFRKLFQFLKNLGD